MADNPFYRLAPFIQEFIYRNGWESLRPIQVAACHGIFNTDDNLLLTAGTASGKTEAAFFPVLSQMHDDPPASVGALYIAPLKALINDQFERLTELCIEGDIAVHHWHGDVAQSKKERVVSRPSGVLQITPESLQALLMHRHNHVMRMFGDLRYVVIDELHSLMRNDRGLQVRCLLEQLQSMIGHAPRRIGLSATVGDPEAAGKWLSAGTGRSTFIPSADGREGLKWRLSMDWFPVSGDGASDGAVAAELLPNETAELLPESGIPTLPMLPPGADPGLTWLFSRCAGARDAAKSLIFCNSREEAEMVTATLRQYCDVAGIPDVFMIHHGNLSAAIREDAETKMKTSDEPRVTVTTATLELGIDIGKLERAFQIDAPFSVSSFLQRMGRTGRRGSPPEMRFLFREEEPDAKAPLPQLIPWKLLQAIALVQLYVEDKFVEPPRKVSYPFSLLYHQTMAALAANGEQTPATLARRVLSMSVFSDVGQQDFGTLLRHLVDKDHIQLTDERGLIVGLRGERVVNHYKFYATFKDDELYAVRCGSEELGTVVSPPPPGDRLAIAGRVWDVKDVDVKKKLVFVSPVKGVVPAFFGLCPGDIHTRVLEKMRGILCGSQEYAYLSGSARQRLDDARRIAEAAGIAHKPLVCLGGDCYCMFPWLGTYAFMALERFLKQQCSAEAGISAIDAAKPYFLQFRMRRRPDELLQLLHDAANRDMEPEGLLYPAEEPVFDKYDEFIPMELVRKHFARDVLNADGARERILSWRSFDIS